MEIEIYKENTKYILNTKAICDIAFITLAKFDEIVFKNDNKIIDCKEDNNEITLYLSLIFKNYIDINKTCAKVKKEIQKAIKDTFNIEINEIYINILGLINKEETC